MKKHTLILASLVLFIQVAVAQTKLLTMEEAIIKQKTTLAPARLKQLMWVKGTDKYSFVDKKENEDVLIIGNAENNKQETVATLKELNDALVKAGLKPLEAFPAMQWNNADQFTFETEKTLIGYVYKAKLISREANRDFGADAEHVDVAKVSNYVAYTIKNNLYVYDFKNKIPVTNDADSNIVNGQSVHRDEFGISKGTYWSPKGDMLAFYRMDQRMVTDYPIIDWTVRPAKVHEIKYPMAGDKSHEVTVGVYNMTKHTTVFLKTGEPKEQYLTNIAWSPDEQHIFIQVLNRDQNEMKLNSYSATTGDFERTFYTQKNDKYVHPMHPIVFLPNKNDEFVLQSEQDSFDQKVGYNHLTYFKFEAVPVHYKDLLIQNKTNGDGKWAITDFAGFDDKGENLYFSSTAESGITRNFYSMNMKDYKITRLTQGDGTHTVMLSDNKKYFIDNFQSTTVPREISIYDTKGKKLQTLKQAENPLKDYKLGQLSLFKLKSDSGDDLFCRMFKPVDFDSTKKYPVIVYLYNGPGVQLINNTWNGGGDMWLQYMAERGYVVFTLDGRGSANRGLAFEQATFRQLGTVEMEDQMVGINYLQSRPWVDSKRMGIMGWSFGGFMTTSIMTRYPAIFKVAVAGGPVIDWSYYEVMYTERYMDTPQTNPDGYKQANVMNHIDNLKGKLLVIHGAQDNVVVWQNSMMFIKACVDKGKQVDYYVYPGHEHNVLGKDRVHLFNKISDYFMQNL